MPATGPLVDRLGRVHDDLRLSVTDRCNFRCTYCMPETGMQFLPRQELLTVDELVRVAAVARRLGVDAVRLTGGEPLLRRELPDIVAALTDLDYRDVALTTNGMLLGRSAARLATAGLSRVNISCDSLRPERFAAIRRRGDLATVLAAMDAAEEAGLRPLKINVVLVAGQNDDEVLDFAELARRTGRTVRFIEFMPLDADHSWRPDRVVDGGEVLAAIDRRYPLVPVGTDGDGDDHAPAERFHFADGAGEIGVVRSVTRPFCGDCNRLRITADGNVRNCLFSDDERPLTAVLRDGGSDEDIEQVLRRAVWAKRAGHGLDDPGFASTRRSMSMIGG
ncbi:MAG: GTP 3',8-cyclase MoaA [Acidimicrobiales bacterium]